MRALFDGYAGRFETHLTGALQYRGPAQLRAAVLAQGPRRFAHALDLGCGTGLSGEAFRDLCERIEGCDLSPAMVTQARAKGVYDALEAEELLAFLGRSAASACDLILAADVFVYMGDLAPVFASCARTLGPGGILAFTVQSLADGARWRLLDDLRFGHARDWIAEQLGAAGFAMRSEPASSRRDRGQDVPGLLVVATRT